MSLVVAQAVGLVTVQDLGRAGHMHEGLALGGALVPELLLRANRAVGNPDDAAALEVLGRLVVRAERPATVATDSREARVLDSGEELSVTSEPKRVTYLSVRGGIDAPMVLGGRGAHLSAGMGAPLRAGARVIPGNAPLTHQAIPEFLETEEIHVIPGPDGLDIAPLLSGTYSILSASDRVGTRLEGAPIPGGEEATRPMVRGAIEVPRDGQPIVLGPEHPTTGGYPVIAVIAHEDLGRFFAIRIGGRVRFRAVSTAVQRGAAGLQPGRASSSQD